MKILHVISNYSDTYAGMAIACREMAEGQAANGIDVTIVTSNLDHPFGILDKLTNTPLIENGVHVIYCSVQFRRLVFSYSLLKTLNYEVSKADVVHIHGLYRFPQTCAAWLAGRFGKPYVISPHGSLNPEVYNKAERGLLRRAYQKFIESRNIKLASAIHFTAVEEQNSAAIAIQRKRAMVIPNGIEKSKYVQLPHRGYFYDNHAVDQGLFKILFLGRISWIKGIDILLKAIPKIKELIPNMILLIVGPDYEGYKEEVMGLINILGIEDCIKFTGPIHRRDVIKAYVDSDIFVLPSYSENFGLTIVESMASGCPVIISNKVNIYQEIVENNLGYVINHIPSQIVDSVLDYNSKTDKEKDEHKLHIRNYALKYFDWKLSILKFIKLYQDLQAR